MEGKVRVSVMTHTAVGELTDVLHFVGRGLLHATESGWHLRYQVRCTDEESGELISAGVLLDRIARRAVLQGRLVDTELCADRPTELRLAGSPEVLTAVTHSLSWQLDGPEAGYIDMKYTLLQRAEAVTTLHVRMEVTQDFNSREHS